MKLKGTSNKRLDQSANLIVEACYIEYAGMLRTGVIVRHASQTAYNKPENKFKKTNDKI